MPEIRVARGSRNGHRPSCPPRRFFCLVLICGSAAVAALAGVRVGPGAVLGASVRVSLAAARHTALRRARPRIPHAAHAAGSGNPLAGRAMWIWEMPHADHGDIASIAAEARRYGIGTLLIKSSDGTSRWPQFNSQLVSTLHANGLRVCAWQYVYGNHPATEADLGADAVSDGADCLVIDAESEYEGKYISAQTYVARLRARVGDAYPVTLAGFPYVDYHLAFPYSVFLGPGGAQYNAPQMYWRDIATTTDAVYAHTYSYNLIYGRPIFPLGQVYGNPPAHQIFRFRELSRIYGASGISWWDWQEATRSAWRALSRPAGVIPGYQPYEVMASIKKGAAGDLVVWAQEHLISAGYRLGVDGGFGRVTRRAVLAFQIAHGLTADGIIGPETWGALLRYSPARILWSTRRSARRATISDAASAGGARAGGTVFAPVPASASKPAKRDELAGAPGRGRP